MTGSCWSRTSGLLSIRTVDLQVGVVSGFVVLCCDKVSLDMINAVTAVVFSYCLHLLMLHLLAVKYLTSFLTELKKNLPQPNGSTPPLTSQVWASLWLAVLFNLSGDLQTYHMTYRNCLFTAWSESATFTCGVSLTPHHHHLPECNIDRSCDWQVTWPRVGQLLICMLFDVCCFFFYYTYTMTRIVLSKICAHTCMFVYSWQHLSVKWPTIPLPHTKPHQWTNPLPFLVMNRQACLRSMSPM